MTSAHERWTPRFHLAPRRGWLNDPNGLCQFHGTYHVFYQADPTWPTPGKRGWGHFASRDLVRWEDLGEAIMPSIPEDADGAYSGSALVVAGGAPDGGDLLRLYYTGNVKYEGDHVHTGRDANQIMVTSEDGVSFSEKEVLLRPGDYPADLTRHVRDPKVWEQGGRYYMALGARRADDAGNVILYDSADAVAWACRGRIESAHPFGYMWECPSVISLGGRDYLVVCPQGLPSEPTRWQNLYQAGYFPLPQGVLETTQVDEATFVELDWGFDFYAPQTFTDEGGRCILIGWMGIPDADYTSAPDGLAWCHCLTVPREVTVGADGLLRQWPVTEIDGLRGFAQPVSPAVGAILPHHHADIELAGIEGDLEMGLDGRLGLSFSADDGLLRMAFRDEGAACGRTERLMPLERLRELRVLVDGSAVEIYVNHGEAVLSTRWFPTADTLLVTLHATCERARSWEMGGEAPSA
ncbi:MAG: glycoside hydrolase family 32 protein [Coriobacteriaceae bacterium]|nr:glycoside hydrolase family 32 protein [Coriobacteriaceae bacterium]